MNDPYTLAQPAEHASNLLAEARKTLFGMDEVLQLCLVAYFCRRHVLLEGNPGLGKTTLVKTLSSVLQLPYRRIQFTPDLMPADITGTLLPDPSQGAAGQWRFQRGPIFTHLLLADEINRATPKTQSAMLEAMEEQQVTVLNETHYVPNDRGHREDDAPFMVLATQNPIDHEGVYNLPEAQTDRFMFKLAVRTPAPASLLSIMAQETGPGGETRPNPGLPAGQPLSPDQQAALAWAVRQFAFVRSEIRKLEGSDLLSRHIANMVLASNGALDLLYDLPRREAERRRLPQLVSLLRFGLGPRAAINLLLGVKAWRLLFTTAPQSRPGPVELARVLLPTLDHRFHWRYDWEEEPMFRTLADGEQRRQLFIAQFALATAPAVDLYRERLQTELAAAIPVLGKVA